MIRNISKQQRKHCEFNQPVAASSQSSLLINQSIEVEKRAQLARFPRSSAAEGIKSKNS